MFVILVLMVNLAGQPVVVGDYSEATYPTMEACEAARPSVVSKIDEANKLAQLHVAQSACASREDAAKLRARIEHKDSI